MAIWDAENLQAWISSMLCVGDRRCLIFTSEEMTSKRQWVNFILIGKWLKLLLSKEETYKFTKDSVQFSSCRIRIHKLRNEFHFPPLCIHFNDESVACDAIHRVIFASFHSHFQRLLQVTLQGLFTPSATAWLRRKRQHTPSACHTNTTMRQMARVLTLIQLDQTGAETLKGLL